MTLAPVSSGGNAAEIYERYMVPAIFAAWVPDFIDQAALGTRERVLDVACGTGVVTRASLDRLKGTGRVVGLDINPGMLAAARTAALNLPIEWHEGNATAMPFEAGTFDVVLCQQGLQFIPDKLAALREMNRVLAPGGRVLLSVWRSTRDTPGFRALEEALAPLVGPQAASLPPFSFGDARRLQALLKVAGFHDIRIRADVKMTRFPTAEVFVQTIVAGAPAMLGQLANQGEAGLALIAAEVARELSTSVDDDGLAFPQASNIARARKT